MGQSDEFAASLWIARQAARATEPVVAFKDSFDKLDIRVGRIIAVELETATPKQTYKMTIDFGKFGKRTSYGRFTQHPVEEVKDRLVLGVLSFAPRQMGPVTSEVLILGVQYPKVPIGSGLQSFKLYPSIDNWCCVHRRDSAPPPTSTPEYPAGPSCFVANYAGNGGVIHHIPYLSTAPAATLLIQTSLNRGGTTATEAGWSE